MRRRRATALGRHSSQCLASSISRYHAQRQTRGGVLTGLRVACTLCLATASQAHRLMQMLTLATSSTRAAAQKAGMPDSKGWSSWNRSWTSNFIPC
jgi:hypothetical protein